MADIIHRVGIKAPIKNVYEGLATIKGLAGWWTQETSGDAKENGQIEFTFKTPTGEIKGKMLMRVQKLIPNKSVVWKCEEGPAEWIGTDLTFELSEQNGYSIVLFGHRNWAEAVEFTAHCSTKWAVFLLSLKELIETGKGKPSPYDIKIDDWN